MDFDLVVMENITKKLQEPILFDLKGSTVNRLNATDEESFNDLVPLKVYKDLDFSKYVGHIKFSQ